MATTNQFPSYEAAKLAAYMSDLSEEAAEATWLTNWEYILWRFVKTGPSTYGRLEVSQNIISELKSLSDQCGGWVVWRNGECWLPMDEWEGLFRKYDKG